jgi:hypothetical protein
MIDFDVVTGPGPTALPNPAPPAEGAAKPKRPKPSLPAADPEPQHRDPNQA